MDISLH